MRREDRAVTNLDDIRAIFEATTECHLAFVMDQTPYGVTMNYGYKEKEGIFTIYLHCAHEGKKIDILRQNPKSYFFAETRCEFFEKKNGSTPSYLTMFYDSIAGEGEIEFLTSLEEKREAMEILINRFSPTLISEFPDSVINYTCVLKMVLNHVSAKRNAPKHT